MAVRSIFPVVALLTTSCVRMGFDDAATLPPVQVDPGDRKISVLHASATRLAGTCTEIGGTVSIYGDADGSAPCVGGGAWRVELDFSAAADGDVTVFAVQHDADDSFSSPPVEVPLQKDTEVCADPTRAAAAPFAAGAGTADDPYRVCNPTQLAEVDNHLDATIRLENDIDVGERPWSWFGTLSGTFDGNGFAIENLHYETTTYPSGLFGDVSGTVKNLGVIDVNIYSYCHVGGVVGILLEGGVVESCYSTGIISSYSDAVGGLVGANSGTVIDSFSAVAVNEAGSICVGGLVGVTDPTGRVSGSYAVGEVKVSGADRVGGLVGCNDGTLENAYARGDVLGSSGSTKIGGLVGENTGTIVNAYSSGLLLGGGVGGLVESNLGTVTSSYWDTEASGQSESAAGVGLGAAAMSDPASYEGWDFESVWRLDDESPYPVLDWQ